MKTAEEWDTYWVASRLDRLDCIRQIQADALRSAAEKARSLNDGHDWPVSRLLDEQANQLDPQPP